MKSSLPPVLIVFKMEGCPHCEAVSGPKSACLALKEVVVLEIAHDHELTKALKIPGFPAVWLSQKDCVHEFTGQRTTADIQDWIHAHIRAE
jgi:hypothetical protein